MKSSLFFRLMTAFALVILVTVTIIFVFANLATTSEFQSFMFRGGMAVTEQVARDLAGYYAAQGSWEGVDRYLVESFNFGMSPMMGGGRGMGGMMGGQVLLADASGTVIASRDGSGIGQKLSSSQLTRGTPIQVQGQTVGTLIDQMPVTVVFDAQQEEFLRRVNFSILVASIVAGGIALVVGTVLLYQITSPLNALAAAARRIEAGDLNARVARTRGDEIGQVGHAFNAMADSLARSETARRNMIADIAHELRNPIGVIQGHLEGMIDGVFPASTEQLESLHEETALLTRLVDDLRELALADAGQLQINRQPASLPPLVEKTVAAFSAQAAEKNATIEIRVPTAIPSVNIDAQRIEQVLRNLLGNALRYTPDGGVVTVQLSVSSKQLSVVRVEIRDSGPGIAAEDLPHVFERFWRGDKSRSRSAFDYRSGGGTGLGLAIAKQLVAAHGGEIGVESRVGQGATFWFTLPVQDNRP